MSRSRVLLVGAGKMGAGFLDAATRRGVELRVAEFPFFADRTRAVAERVSVPGAMLEESWYAAALEALDGDAPDAVLAFSEPHVLAAALCQDTAGVPGPGMHAATIARNKALQRAVFAAAGIAQPEHTLVPDVSSGADWAEGRFPVVLKSVGDFGSIGVELVADEEQLEEAAARRSDHGRVLVEEAVEGSEFSAECLVRDGRVLFTNVTAKETTGPPFFVEVCHRPGHRFALPEEQESVGAFVLDVVRALRMRTGIVHLEFRMVSGRGPVLIEVAVRTPGDFIMDVVSATWGFDMFDAVLGLALGEEIDLPGPADEPVAYAASRFLLADPGMLESIDGLDEIRSHPAVVRCVLNLAVGDRVPAGRSSMDRAGHVLVVGADRSARDLALGAVTRTVSLVTRQGAGA
jgi:biotin carboxylase